MLNGSLFQYWAYIFEDPEEPNKNKWVYAFSEKRARQKFKKQFYRDAGKLIRREPW